MQLEEIETEVKRTIAEFSAVPETQLIGAQAVLKSRQLVQVLLALEEFSEDRLHTEFDWRSDSAMSASRSIFRTVGVLAGHLHQLQPAG